MTELDEIWSKMLAETAVKASRAGRRHVVEYLLLKTANDAIRAAASTWLLDTMAEIALAKPETLPAVKMERESPHNFTHHSSNMVGSLIRLRSGVRCLTVDAGWVRTPSDGIMKAGALALARIRHFGLPRLDAELRLVRGTELPRWLDTSDVPVDSAYLAAHIAVLLENEKP
ncbi:MAG: hypothetical protein WKF34_06540 [Pyrinomonadaceae bacterium]